MPASRAASEAEARTPDGGEGALDRGIALLSCLSAAGSSLTAAELSDLTSIPRSTVHRLLRTLVAAELVVKVPGRRYAIGLRAWEFGEHSLVARQIRDHAIPHLFRLFEVTGEPVRLVAINEDVAPEDHLTIVSVVDRDGLPTLGPAAERAPLLRSSVWVTVPVLRPPTKPFASGVVQLALVIHAPESRVDPRVLENLLTRAARELAATLRVSSH